MAKGQQRGNREAKKPKKAKLPVTPASTSFTPGRTAPGARVPGKKK
jgi:hypothetical protein